MKKNIENIKLIVPGWLNTDIVWIWVPEIVWKGELASWWVCRIWPWWKSRNIAAMAAILLWENKVAMIWKTSKDEFWLWRKPVEALEKNGVNIDFIKILDFEETWKMPWIALIPVDKDWNNQIYSIPWINEDFSEKDIDDAEEIFKIAWDLKWTAAYSLEMPFKTVLHAMDKADKFWLKNIFDPWWMEKNKNYSELFKRDIFLIKPNEHEAKMLTWVEVKDFETAENSAKVFFEKWIKNVLITAWKDWAYFFKSWGNTENCLENNFKKHYEIPDLKKVENPELGLNIKDETWCWDQTMATLCSFLSKWYEIEKSIEIAILSWTLQFHKAWIWEIKILDIERYIKL